MSDNILNLHFTIDHSGVSVKYENRDLGLFVRQMKIEAIERLCDKIKKITEPKYMELSLRACKFIGLEILDTQSSKVVL